MPQASDDQRNLMGKWFKDRISDDGPYRFLRSHGFTEQGGMLFPPTSDYTISCYEMHCLQFLHDEWDYDFIGGAMLKCLCGEIKLQ